MEDLSRDLERAVTPPGIPDSPKRSGGWTLLFIGSNGKIVRLDKFRALIAAWVLVFFMASVAAVSFGFFYFDQASQTKSLKDALRSGRERLDALREEKEILLTRAVVAESEKRSARSESQPGEASPKQKEKPAKPESQVQEASTPNRGIQAQPIPNPDREREKTTAVQISAVSPVLQTRPAIAEMTSSSGRISSGIKSLVDVGDFFSIAEPDSNTLRIKYKIRNIDPKSNPISGRTFLILKPKKEDPGKWTVLPEVPLESGMPSSFQNGRSFSITRFKTFRFKAPYLAGPEPFETATILVFDANGGLLLEKNFALIDKEDESEPTG